jgi:hypothetical protein
MLRYIRHWFLWAVVACAPACTAGTVSFGQNGGSPGFAGVPGAEGSTGNGATGDCDASLTCPGSGLVAHYPLDGDGRDVGPSGARFPRE